MSLSPSAAKFEKAADYVAAQCAMERGCDLVIANLKARANAHVTDPRLNRELIVEPWEDSQQIGVPERTVRAICAELAKINALHIWARAKCPDSDFDNAIIETDSAREFKDAVESLCPNCGEFHATLTWSDVETFYAINLTEKTTRLRLGSLLLKPRGLPGQDESRTPISWSNRITDAGMRVLSFFSQGRQSATGDVIDALKRNDCPVQPPTFLGTAVGIFFGALAAIAASIAIWHVVGWFDQRIAVVVLVVLWLTAIISSYIAWQVILRDAAQERNIYFGATVLAFGLLGSEGLGWRVKAVGAFSLHGTSSAAEDVPEAEGSTAGIFDVLFGTEDMNAAAIWGAVTIYIAGSAIAAVARHYRISRGQGS